MELFCNRSTLIKHKIDIHGFIPPPIIKKAARIKPKRARPRPSTQSQKTQKPKIINPVICGICNKIFLSLKRLNEHKLCHSKPFKCSICNKAFGKKWNLKVHKKIHLKNKNNEDIMKRCKFCDKSFNDPSSLKKHIRRIHCNESGLGIKPFRCRKCMKEFKRKDSLQKHWQSHESRENRKLFKCDLCDHTFVFNHNRLKHQKITHTS